MITFLLSVIGLVGFFYLNDRIGRIENLLKRDSGERPAQPREEQKMPVFKERQPERQLEAQEVQLYTAPKPKTQYIEPSVKDKDIEFKFGSRVFTGVGIIAVLFAIGFFLRYAFQNDLITETMRVVLGLFGGAILVVVGWFTGKRYPAYGQAVTGGGLGLFYLSLYAAYNYYSLISQPFAFTAMIVVTVLGVALAVFYNSLPLAVFAQVGGFLTPFILSSGQNSPHALFLYIIILNFGMLATAWWKIWPHLTLLSFVGTVLAHGAWFGEFYSVSQFGISFFYTTAFFLIFLAASVFHQVARGDTYRGAYIALALLNPAFYFTTNIFEIDKLYPDFSTLFTVAIAVLYLVLGLLFKALRSDESSTAFSQFMLAVSFIFFVLAVPIQFDSHWITIAWGVEALAVLALGFFIRSQPSRVFALGIFLLVLFRLFAFDLSLPVDAIAWANDRVMTFFISFALFAAASVMYYIARTKAQTENLSLMQRQEYNFGFSYTLVASYLVFFTVLTAEIFQFHGHFWAVIIWSILALGAGALSLVAGSGFLRAAAYITLFGAALRVVTVDGAISLARHTPFFNTRVLETLVLVAALSLFLWLTHTLRDKLYEGEARLAEPAFFAVINGLLLWLISVEVMDYFNKRIRDLLSLEHVWRSGDLAAEKLRLMNIKKAALSVSWTVYSIILLVIGIVKKSAPARITSTFLFGIVVLKVFLYDTASLNDFYRFVSFITLGIILLLSGFLYYRFRERITQFIGVERE